MGGDRREILWLFNPVSNRLQLATNNMSPDVLEQYVQNIRHFKPDYIQGYASVVAAIARYMETNNTTYPLKAVMTSSEKLTASDRQVIEKVFQCKVFDRYGLGEEVVSAIECEYQEGYHVEIDRCYAEVIGGHGQAVEGEVGNIVATNLVNYAFPLIRYDTGDLGAIKYEECNCGRKLPVIFELVGRNSEYLMNKNRVKQTGSLVSQHITMPEGVLAYQIEQIELDHFMVHFCSSSIVDLSEQVRKTIKQFVETVLYVENPNIIVEQCSSIPVAENGKMKYLISHIQ